MPSLATLGQKVLIRRRPFLDALFAAREERPSLFPTPVPDQNGFIALCSQYEAQCSGRGSFKKMVTFQKTIPLASASNQQVLDYLRSQDLNGMATAIQEHGANGATLADFWEMIGQKLPLSFAETVQVKKVVMSLLDTQPSSSLTFVCFLI